MQIRSTFPPMLAVAIACLACACNKDNISKKTHVYYSLNGASCNGEFSIVDDGDPTTLIGSAIIVGASGDDPEVVILTITDYDANREVAFQLPAKKGGPILLLEDSEYFGMGIIDGENDWTLSSGVKNTLRGVSIDITKFERGQGLFGLASLKQMEGNFEGIMTYENEMHEIEEHTVKGDFFYNGTY